MIRTHDNLPCVLRVHGSVIYYRSLSTQSSEKLGTYTFKHNLTQLTSFPTAKINSHLLNLSAELLSEGSELIAALWIGRLDISLENPDVLSEAQLELEEVVGKDG